MARFVVEERIEEGSDDEQIWDRLRQYCIAGRTVELVRRTLDGVRVIEVRRWKGLRDDGSNRVSASPETDY